MQWKSATKKLFGNPLTSWHMACSGGPKDTLTTEHARCISLTHHLTDEQWALIEPLIHVDRIDRTRKVETCKEIDKFTLL
jgi:hypothetical protein